MGWAGWLLCSVLALVGHDLQCGKSEQGRGVLSPAHWKAKSTMKETGGREEDVMLKVSTQGSSCSSAPLHCGLGQVTFSTAHLPHYERDIVAPAQSASWSPARIKFARFAMELLYNANLNE